MPSSALSQMLQFIGSIGKTERFYRWAGVGTGPYIHENKVFCQFESPVNRFR